MLRLLPIVRGIAALSLPLLVVACPIDDRLLVAEQPDAAKGKAGKGGSGAGGSGARAGFGGADAGDASDAPTSGGTGANGGVAGSGGDGGEGGTAASGGGAGAGGSGGTDPITDCPDLNRNQVSDCDESLVSNPDFDETEADWQKEANQTQSWESVDANDVSQSGSLGVTNTTVIDQDGIVMAGATQCVQVAGAKNYGIFGQIMLKNAPGASGAFNVLFFDAEGCAGTVVASYTSPQTSLTDVWETVQGGTLAPSTAKSMRVRLVSIKSFRQPTAQALFDNVLVRAE